MLIIFLKLFSGYVIGSFIGSYFSKNKMNYVLGLALVMSLTLVTCMLIDYLLLPL